MTRTCNFQRLLLGSVTVLAFSAAGALAASDHFKNSEARALPPLPAAQIKSRQPTAATMAEWHRELGLLHLKTTRPGKNPRDPDAPDAANYDEALANPFPRPSDVLRLKNGGETKTAAEWTNVRRPQIVKAFEDEIYGHQPAVTPGVKWEVISTKNVTLGGAPAVSRELIGHVDNSGAPNIKTDIELNITMPANPKGRIPMMIVFGFKRPPGQVRGPVVGAPPPGPDYNEQLVKLGWGAATLNTPTIQADTGEGLTSGVIGIANHGKVRKMDDWGSLRAWAWGAGRTLDYLSTDPHVAADEVGIEGHSRYGKAAAVTMAFDPRFAIGYISSSGAGGVKLLRRNAGETVEDVAAPNEFHWMAGNFLKYGADPLTANDMPVDGDALIALAAPRPVFVGAGAMAAGDAWVDARGMFISAVGASPVYRLLGKQGVIPEKFPGVGPALLKGDIGFRQHQYGHTDVPNWPVFLQFAQKYLHVKS